MPRRRPNPPDTRYRWDDPNIPALCEGVENATGKRVLVWTPPDIAQKHYAWRVQNSLAPSWRRDRTYHLKK